MPVTIVTGNVATDTVNQSQRVPDIDPKIEELEPNAAPLVTLTKKLRKVPAIGPKVEWLEHEPLPRFDVLSASAASNATALPVTNGNYFRVGDVIRNTNTGVGFEVTATAAGAITVGAALGAVAASAHASGDEIFIVSNLNAEGAGLRQIKSAKVANLSNYTQIVRTPWGVTGTEAATKLYGGPDPQRLKAEAAVEHMRQWEQIAITGAKSENLTVTGAPKRTAGGLTEFATTNVTATIGAMSEATFQTWLRTAFRYTSTGPFSGRKILLASPLFLSVIEGYARTNLQVVNDRAETYGIRMKTYVSGNGEVDIITEPWFADSLVYRGWAIAIDLDSIAYCPLRDTKHMDDRQANDLDSMQGEWLTEATFVFRHERRFAIAKGVTGGA